MRAWRCLILASLLTTPALGAGWRTVVTDRDDGTRSAGIIGSESQDERQGMAIPCPSEGLPAMIFVTVKPSRRFEIRPGDSAIATIGALELNGTIERNDSRRTSAWLSPMDFPAFLEEIRATDGALEIGLASGEFQETIAIPSDGFAAAYGEFLGACQL